jgi:hypothetical protein
MSILENYVVEFLKEKLNRGHLYELFFHREATRTRSTWSSTAALLHAGPARSREGELVSCLPACFPSVCERRQYVPEVVFELHGFSSNREDHSSAESLRRWVNVFER